MTVPHHSTIQVKFKYPHKIPLLKGGFMGHLSANSIKYKSSLDNIGYKPVSGVVTEFFNYSLIERMKPSQIKQTLEHIAELYKASDVLSPNNPLESGNFVLYFQFGQMPLIDDYGALGKMLRRGDRVKVTPVGNEPLPNLYEVAVLVGENHRQTLASIFYEPDKNGFRAIVPVDRKMSNEELNALDALVGMLYHKRQMAINNSSNHL